MAGLLGMIGGLFGLGGLWRRGMPIMRMAYIDPVIGEYCEAAIAANQFKGHGVDESGDHILSIRRGQALYVVKVEVQKSPHLGDALLIVSASETSPNELSDDIIALGGRP